MKRKSLAIMPLLLLCIATLCVGIYAVVPLSVAITGPLTIIPASASNISVNLSMTATGQSGDDIVVAEKTVKGAKRFSVADLLFSDISTIEKGSEDEVIVTFTIKNNATASTNQEKSDNAIGVFFSYNASIGDRTALASDILVQDLDSTINPLLSSYTAILPQETEKMEITLRLDNVNSFTEADVPYYIYVEEYVSEATTDGLVKLPIINSDQTLFTEVNGTTISSMGIAKPEVQYVAMPSTVTTIANGSNRGYNGAFSLADKLAGISLSSNLTTIGSYVFYNCDSLTSIILPAGVQTIGSYTFSGCKFTEVKCNIVGTNYSLIDGELQIKTMHQGASGHPEWYSANVSPLVTSVTFLEESSRITTIGHCAFFGCSSLTSISLPASVQTICGDAFSDCRFTEVKCNIVGTNYSLIDGELQIKTMHQETTYVRPEWTDVSQLVTSVTFLEESSSITTIGPYAFYNCSSLTSISLPSYVQIIDVFAFWSCSNLTSISIPESVKTINDYAFSGCKFTEVKCNITGTNYSLIDGELKIKTMHQATRGHPEWYDVNPLVTSVTFLEKPSSITTIGSYAFNGCSSLTSISLPNNVQTIVVYAFSGCRNLEITIPSSVTSIGEYTAFSGVKKVVFNGNVEQMETMLPAVTDGDDVQAYFFVECADGYYEYVNIYFCILSDTEIICWDKKRKRWTKKKLKDLTYDDELLVWNFDEGKFDKAKPMFITKECKATRYTQTTFSDGSVLNTIGEDDSRRHRLFNVETGRFEYIGTNMKIGTKTFNSKGEIVEIVDMKFIDKEVTYQNVITEKHFNAFASGILTSCRLNNLYPIKDMKYVKDNRTLNKKEDFAEVEDMYFEGLRLAEQPVGSDAFSEVTACKDLKDYVKRLKARSKER